jgi:hypothetical protein
MSVVKTLLIVLPLLAQTGPAPALTGRWDVVTRSRGGIGAWLTFAADGSCTQTTGAMVDGTWQLTGDRLTRSVVATPEGKVETETFTVAIQGTALRLGPGTDRPAMTRVGQPTSGAPPLPGVWTWPHLAGGTAFEDYQPDGRYLFRLPIKTDPCQWAADGGELRLTTRGEMRTFQWRLAGNDLTLIHDGKADAFRREQTVFSVSRR